MNISENLQRILTDKQNIANAINAKGVSCQFSESLDTYADKISRISGGDGETGGGGGGETGAGGLITSQDAPKTYTKDKLSKVYENYCIIGALLSKQGDTWTIWNTNPSETGYWNPKSDTITTPSTQYGEVVAVCVGRGLWAKIGWSGLTTGYMWAATTSDALYTNYHTINIHGNGWESTNHMFTAHTYSLEHTIWEQLKNGKTADYDLYLPSKYELLEIHNNTCDGSHKEDSEPAHTFDKNLGKLLSLSTSTYWSSSQYSDSDWVYEFAFTVDFENGSVNGYDKTSEYRSVALLHF